MKDIFIGHTGATVKCQKCGKEYYEPHNVSTTLIRPGCVKKKNGIKEEDISKYIKQVVTQINIKETQQLFVLF